jgi:transcriptional regulator with PAS, ATPase and Fis domain
MESSMSTVVALAPPARPAPARYAFDCLVGGSPALLHAIRIARTASTNDLPVLLRGESGVGKEVFAQAIHTASARARAPFVAVNCAALPRDLVESELFGYAPGAFTGARRDGGVGKFEAADGGTLFLDEIGELPRDAQAALLRALQEGEVTRVGEAQPRRIDVRLIAATQRAADAMAGGPLRADLYYRLAVLLCDVPPLRDRLGDLPLLIERFLADACRELRRPQVGATPALHAALARHRWPGNVRELRNLIRRLVALSSGDPIGVEDLPPELRVGDEPATVAAGGDDQAYAGGEGRDGDDRRVGAADPDDDSARMLAALASERTASGAARALGIARSTLYRRMKRHGVEIQHTAQLASPRR